MTQSFALVGLFLLLMALLPLLVRWVRRRSQDQRTASSMASRVISAVAVGPHQRVVTVEIGPRHARIWLVLGVTAQAVTCLHRLPAEPDAIAQEAGADTSPTEAPVARRANDH